MKTLFEFLSEWLAWVDDGADKDNKLFDRHAGLCCNLEGWLWSKHKDDRDFRGAVKGLEYLLKLDFGVDKHYPFGGREFFESEVDYGQCHNNAARVKWVRELIEIYKGDKPWK